MSDNSKTKFLRLPRIDVERVILTFGLLSKKDNENNKWQSWYQFGVSLFILLNAIRYIALFLLVTPGSIWGVYLGDLAFYMAPDERTPCLMVMVLANVFWLHSPFYIYQESLNKGKKLKWLDLLKNCSLESFDFGRIGLCRAGAKRWRKRVLIATWLSILYVVSLALICGIFGMYIGVLKFPVGYRLTYGVFHALVFTVDCFYVIAFSFGMIFVFHQITYFFVIRFDDINSKVKFLKNQSLPVVRRNLLPTLKTMNSLYNLVYRFNQFWKYVLILDYSIILLMVSLLAYLGFFTQMDGILRLMCGLGSCFLFVVLCALSISAALVINKVSNEEFRCKCIYHIFS